MGAGDGVGGGAFRPGDGSTHWSATPRFGAMVEAIVAEADPEQAVLFGSRGRPRGQVL